MSSLQFHLALNQAIFGVVDFITRDTPLGRFSRSGVGRRLRPHQTPMPVDLVKSHRNERNGNGKPVEVIRYDCAVGCGIRPPKYSVEDPPATSAINFRTATL